MKHLKDKYPEAYNELKSLVLDNPDLESQLEPVTCDPKFYTYTPDETAVRKIIPALITFFETGEDKFDQPLVIPEKSFWSHS